MVSDLERKTGSIVPLFTAGQEAILLLRFVSKRFEIVLCLAMTAFRVKKPLHKRNAFGNHSKGIINLNLKLNYEKICALKAIF